MNVTAREIHEKQFHDAWRGYNQDEVDDFLDLVAEVLDRVDRENADLRRRVGELEQAVATSREAEEMLKKTLVTAQQAAEEAIAKAKAKADQLVTEAQERARRISEESRERVATAEADIRRKSLEADREHSTRKRDMEASIERLVAFEAELKKRLRSFLEQQMRALDVLTERATTGRARVDEAQPAATGARVHTPPLGTNGETDKPEPTAEEQSRERDADEEEAEARESSITWARPAEEEERVAEPQRRGGVRGLFWGRDDR